MTRFSKWAGSQVLEPGSKDAPRIGRPEVETFVVVNSILESRGRGIKYRRSPKLDDKCSSKVATFGSLVRGTLYDEDWLKVGQRLFLPRKIDGLYVLLRHDGAGLAIARQEISDATVHFRLEVNGCRHPRLGKLIRGSFVRSEDHHGRPAYRRVDEEAACYFWDSRDGLRYCGWWFGPLVGCDQGWAQQPCNDEWPPGHGWEVPWGEEVDHKLTCKLVETKTITVSGHSNSSYDGPYDLQPEAMNGHPWFKKASPFRVLYCVDKGFGDGIHWNLDHREQSGVFDWADGGQFGSGFLPLGEERWTAPSNLLTLSWDDHQDHVSDESEQEAGKDHDPWSMIEPWEAWYSESMGIAVYYNKNTGERVESLEETTVNPGIIRSLKRLQPKCLGTVDRLASSPARAAAPRPRAAAAPVEVDPPSEPGVAYVVASPSGYEGRVAKIHRSPDPSSREYSYVEEGGPIELYGWDPTQLWRMCWHCFGMTDTAGCWAWVRFLDDEGRTLFKPKGWLARALPFGLLGVAIYEDDPCLLRQLVQEHADLNRKEQNLTPLTLAEHQDRADLCVRLLDAGAELPPPSHRPSKTSMTGTLLSALAGQEEFDLKVLDTAMDGLQADTRDIAEKMLDRIAEEQAMRRKLDAKRQERAAAELKARKAFEEAKERAARTAEAEGRAEEKRRAAREVAEERQRCVERERAEQASAQAAADFDRHAEVKQELPPEEAQTSNDVGNGEDAALEQARQRRQKMAEKRTKRMEAVRNSAEATSLEAAPADAAAAAAPPAGAEAAPAPAAEAVEPPPVPVDPEKAAIQARREERLKAREERQAKARQEAEARLAKEHEERMRALEAEGQLHKIEREQRKFEIALEEAEHEAEEQVIAAELDNQIASAEEKWTCGECNFDSPVTSNCCLFCETERGAGFRGHLTS